MYCVFRAVILYRQTATTEQLYRQLVRIHSSQYCRQGLWCWPNVPKINDEGGGDVMSGQGSLQPFKSSSCFPLYMLGFAHYFSLTVGPQCSPQWRLYSALTVNLQVDQSGIMFKGLIPTSRLRLSIYKRTVEAPIQYANAKAPKHPKTVVWREAGNFK